MAELSEQQFIDLIKKSEKAAEENPSAYKFKLALFAMLGYFVIFTIITFLVILVGGTVGIAFLSSSIFLLLLKKKFIFIIAVAIWTFIKALWVKFDAPTGHEISREDYPILFAEIDDLTKKLDSLKIDQVLLQDNLNAAVVQSPKHGLFGGQRNTLMLGIQLMLAVSPEEMRSVLAHEFGHLSGNHSRFAGWIYRVRIRWNRIMHAFADTSSFGASLMRRFFDWYAPKFSAYSFALARGNEYEADQIAAELTSPEVAAKALVNIHATAPYIDEQFWDRFINKADELPEPPHMPYSALADFLKSSPIQDEKMDKLIGKQMEVETHYADTHPALKDRIKAITNKAVKPDSFDVNAAEVWLADKYSTTLQHFDQNWASDNVENWTNRFNYVQESKATIMQYKETDLSKLDDDELWKYAAISNEFVDDKTALPIYEMYNQRHPESVGSSYHIGRILIANKDEAGLKYLKAARESLHTIDEAARWGYQFLVDSERKEEADVWWEESLEVNQRLQTKAAELESVTIDDYYIKPDINDELMAAVVDKVKAHKKIGSCWMAEKVLDLNKEEHVYILSYKLKGISLSAEKVTKELASSFDLGINIFFITLTGDTKKFAKKVKKAGVKIC